MPGKLSTTKINDAIANLDGWEGSDSELSKQFKFADHITAVGFAVRVAMAAEVMDHHPDLRIVYNTVDFHLSSHDAGGVTDRDLKLAAKINELAS